VIVSNTSSLPMDDLARFVEGPGRFCGMHWFNPPEWTPGVEVIPAANTDARTVERLVGFLRSIGKRPAVVGSGPGFVANRIQNALFLEAVRCVEEGLASPEEVDEVVRSCFGFRLPFFGPFAIADMAGLDVYASVLGVLRDGLGERFEPPRMLLDLVEEGRTGTKSGAGFLDYTDEERERLLLERDRRYAALLELLERLPPAGAGRETDDRRERPGRRRGGHRRRNGGEDDGRGAARRRARRDSEHVERMRSRPRPRRARRGATGRAGGPRGPV
jgi:3-hydroxybutyryl-CoA dehydrogenase